MDIDIDNFEYQLLTYLGDPRVFLYKANNASVALTVLLNSRLIDQNTVVVFDLDDTIFTTNANDEIDREDVFLPEIQNSFVQIYRKLKSITSHTCILTGRSENKRAITERSLKKLGLEFSSNNIHFVKGIKDVNLADIIRRSGHNINKVIYLDDVMLYNGIHGTIERNLRMFPYIKFIGVKVGDKNEMIFEDISSQFNPTNTAGLFLNGVKIECIYKQETVAASVPQPTPMAAQFNQPTPMATQFHQGALLPLATHFSQSEQFQMAPQVPQQFYQSEPFLMAPQFSQSTPFPMAPQFSQSTPFPMVPQFHMAAAVRNSPIIRPADNAYGTLTNVGNSCYLNTSLQLLYRIHTLRVMLQNINLNTPEILEAANRNRDIYNAGMILQILQFIFNKFSGGERNINLVTEGVYKLLVETSGLTCGAQEDMSEFMLNILRIISNFYSNPLVKSFIDSITYNHIEIKKCENGNELIRNPIDIYHDEQVRIHQLPKTLDLPIDERATNIQELIAIYQEPERLIPPNDMLDGCVITNGRRDYNRKAISTQNIIRELPSSEYCLISLKRRLPTDATFTEYYKNTHRIEVNPNIIIDNGRYQIIGCGLHTGNANGGHYIFIDYNDNGLPAVTFNDSMLDQVSPYEAETINNEAYMFLYKKIAYANPTEREAAATFPAEFPAAAFPGASGFSQTYKLEKIREKIEQIKLKIRELRIYPYSQSIKIGLNGFVQMAIQLYIELSDYEKTQIGPFIPIEAIEYLDIKIPDNLISYEPMD